MNIWDVATLAGVARIIIGLAVIGAIVWVTGRRRTRAARVPSRPKRPQPPRKFQDGDST